MKFKNMKEVGDYIEKLRAEGVQLEEETKLFKTIREDAATARTFFKSIVKEIGD